MKPNWLLKSALPIACLSLSSWLGGQAQGISANACAKISPGLDGALNGFVPSPDDAWHQDISKAEVDPQSALIIDGPKNSLKGYKLHPDFGGNGRYGIPYVVLDSAKVPGISMLWTNPRWQAQGDTLPYPVPDDLAIEGKPVECPKTNDDRHAIILDRTQCVDYEIYQTSHCEGGWRGTNGAVWDMTISEQRPLGYTSVDAAGLSVFEGLVRYDEIENGVINHALRFTAKFTRMTAKGSVYTSPANHGAGTIWGTDVVMGMRIRLKADYDIAKFPKTDQIILTAMKKYGMILADNGGTLFFQGTSDKRWNDNELNQLKSVGVENFELVKMGPVYDDSSRPPGKKPSIKSFKASATKVKAGDRVTLTADVKDASYSVIDKGGFVRGPIVVTPAETTTYTLVSNNAFGRSTASVTVTVEP